MSTKLTEKELRCDLIKDLSFMRDKLSVIRHNIREFNLMCDKTEYIYYKMPEHTIIHATKALSDIVQEINWLDV